MAGLADFSTLLLEVFKDWIIFLLIAGLLVSFVCFVSLMKWSLGTSRCSGVTQKHLFSGCLYSLIHLTSAQDAIVNKFLPFPTAPQDFWVTNLLKKEKLKNTKCSIKHKENQVSICVVWICVLSCVPMCTYTVVYVSHVLVMLQRHIINVTMGFRKHSHNPPAYYLLNLFIYLSFGDPFSHISRVDTSLDGCVFVIRHTQLYSIFYQTSQHYVIIWFHSVHSLWLFIYFDTKWASKL